MGECAAVCGVVIFLGAYSALGFFSAIEQFINFLQIETELCLHLGKLGRSMLRPYKVVLVGSS
jgi:hypothetical protein